jgi:hypothetical protein
MVLPAAIAPDGVGIDHNDLVLVQVCAGRDLIIAIIVEEHGSKNIGENAQFPLEFKPSCGKQTVPDASRSLCRNTHTDE